jgi:toxin ParE1/3/4
MARLIWTEPALLDLDEIAAYIALDNPQAASRFVRTVFEKVERLKGQPESGRHPPELARTPYREVVVPPCRLFYRTEDDKVYILYVMRSERLLRAFRLEQRDKDR